MTAREALKYIAHVAQVPGWAYDELECVAPELVAAAEAVGAVLADPEGAYRIRIKEDDFREPIEGYMILSVFLEHRHADRPWQPLYAAAGVEVTDDTTVSHATISHGELNFVDLGETLRKGRDCGLRQVAEVASELLPPHHTFWTIPRAGQKTAT